MFLFEFFADPRSGKLQSSQAVTPVFVLFMILVVGVFYAEFRLRRKHSHVAVSAKRLVAKPGRHCQRLLSKLAGRDSLGLLMIIGLTPGMFAQTAFSWQQIKDKFEVTNPTLKAARLSIDESRAAEITAYFRPNPDVTMTIDQINLFSTQPSPSGGGNGYRPFAFALPFGSISYLHERQRKRELRLESAKKSTDVATSNYLDQERSLIFSLRNAFVQTLQAKAVLQNAKENLDYWDRELTVNRARFKAGDLAQVDLGRLELQRVQFESDYEMAVVNLRTAKIQLLTLLNDRTPIEQLDVAGPYDFAEQLTALQEFRDIALDTRPDLKAALQSVDFAKVNHRLAIANGSTDPTFGVDFARNPPIPVYLGFSVTIPLRIFDRNQGEKERTRIDIKRNERLRDVAEAQVFADVDSAYITLVGVLNLLHPYKTKYLQLATDNRTRISFSYQNGGASLLDYLDSEKAYRDTRLAYLNLVGAYLTAAAQMNMAVGREILQ
jgi:cobalt-zinc-cadmium efflux system outer membrane protein